MITRLIGAVLAILSALWLLHSLRRLRIDHRVRRAER